MMIESMRAKMPMLGYAGDKEDVRIGSVSVASVDWSRLVPASLSAYDSTRQDEGVMEAVSWEQVADEMPPYFHGFTGLCESQGAKYVTWGKAMVERAKNKYWITIVELPI